MPQKKAKALSKEQEGVVAKAQLSLLQSLPQMITEGMAFWENLLKSIKSTKEELEASIALDRDLLEKDRKPTVKVRSLIDLAAAVAQKEAQVGEDPKVVEKRLQKNEALLLDLTQLHDAVDTALKYAEGQEVVTVEAPTVVAKPVAVDKELQKFYDEVLDVIWSGSARVRRPKTIAEATREAVKVYTSTLRTFEFRKLLTSFLIDRDYNDRDEEELARADLESVGVAQEVGFKFREANPARIHTDDLLTVLNLWLQANPGQNLGGQKLPTDDDDRSLDEAGRNLLDVVEEVRKGV